MVFLVCPGCDEPLDEALTCNACKVSYPRLGRIPFLYADPDMALLDWRNRMNMAMANLEEQIRLTQPAQPPSLVSSRKRLQHLQAAYQDHAHELHTILEPLQVGQARARETYLALKTRLFSHHGISTYNQNIFRDWHWGDAENTKVIAHLADVLKPAIQTPVKRMLVLGCGAGRLAYDLHQQLNCETTWALDTNPLLCLIGDAVTRGEKVAFTEFPIAPLNSDLAAISRVLSLPQGRAKEPGLKFVCADALRPPFPVSSFDLVVTPWLVDVFDASVNTLMETVASLLKPNGIWLNHGSMAFQGTDPAQRLTGEEFSELSQQLKFEIVSCGDIELPYLQSPASRNHRVEITYTQVARWPGPVLQVPRKKNQNFPQWLVMDNQPVPLESGFQQQITTTRIHSFIMSLIDGRRSIKDMAAVMEQQKLMPADQAQIALRQFLTTMHEEAVHFSGNNVDPQ
ncbi:MAG: methyltransferase domain-containing protein [Gammaproteobacteria bacterium]|nr:methyltransferase domain-containing protein [Gammaproteobacteria bacterium]